LTREQFERHPRQAAPAALAFDTRKTVEQQQLGLLLNHRADAGNRFQARAYVGRRDVWQALAFAGDAPGASGGIIDLANDYRGLGASWTHSTRTGSGLPLEFTLGLEADVLDQRRLGFVNDQGNSGELRR